MKGLSISNSATQLSESEAPKLHTATHLLILSNQRSSRSSSSSSQPPFRLLMTMLPAPSLSRVFSATAPRSSFSCSSVTLLRSCPERASVINLFSTSVARDSLTRRILPSRSDASGSSIWESMEARASAEGMDQCLVFKFLE